MKKKYITPKCKVYKLNQNVYLCGVYATAPDMKGEMNCPCDGDHNKCTCGDVCDCWGCGGWETRKDNNFNIFNNE